jgi:D-alanine-D-alanine ligase
MVKQKVAVIFGGRSAEHEISLISAQAIMDALDTDKYQVIPFGITRQGEWLTEQPMSTLKKRAEGILEPAPTSHSGIPLDELMTADVVFPVLHGPYGEDGTIQGLLEILGLPYVGAGVTASALGMDKALQKTLLRQNNIAVPDFLIITRYHWQSRRDETINAVEQRIGYPCFVKPSGLGSSIGINKAQDQQQLIRALDDASYFDTKLLVEQAIDAREIECSVLGNEEPIASLLGEIVPAGEFYDYESKYLSDQSQLIIPADLPQTLSDEIRRLAVQAFTALDCAGMARVDFLLERTTNRIFLSEINTIPGFTPISMYPKLWEAADISFSDLVDQLIRLGLERHEQRTQTFQQQRNES